MYVCVCIYICCYSVAHLCPTLCNLMDNSMPGFPVPHYFPKFAQTHVHWIGNAIQPAHPLCLILLLPSVFPSIRIWLFASGGQSIRASASVLPMNIQGWFSLRLTGLISLQSKGLSRIFSSTIVWRHQFFNAQPPLWSTSHIHTWLLEKS